MTVKVGHEALAHFVTSLYEALGARPEEARTDAEVLVAADLRGVTSHGVGSLGFKVEYVKKGYVNMASEMRVVRDRPATAVLDADRGFGSVAGKRAMALCIEKAAKTGVGFVSVKDSTHYGIAGYYSMLALEDDMIGFSMTNAIPLMVPTFGTKAVLGTNPISVAAPAGEERAFVLDMATSVVASGKLDVASRKGETIPEGWVIDSEERSITNPGDASNMIYTFEGGGILPLGGVGEAHGGHKGYGLSLLVDILSGVLSGSAFGPFLLLHEADGLMRENVGHFFGAISIDAFQDVATFKASMDTLLRSLKTSPREAGQERIYIHGEKEFEAEEERRRSGIPLHDGIVSNLRALAEELSINFDLLS